MKKTIRKLTGRNEFYIALVFLALYRAAGVAWASIAAIAATVLLRSLSAHYRWNFPHAE